jgi:hypothetical protein
VAPGTLKFKHDISQLLIGDLGAIAQMTDVVVLAKVAQQIAMRKKDCAGTMFADKGILLAKMCAKA